MSGGGADREPDATGFGGAPGASGRRVIVAGATSAAGRDVCDALDAAGAEVIALGSDAGRLSGVTAHERHVIDLTDATAVDALARSVGAVDGLIHLVGGWRRGQSDDDWDWLELRILTTLRNTSRAFKPAIERSSAGRFAIVGSTAVEHPTWSNANYATLKQASETWIAALAASWTGSNAAAITLVVRALGDSGTPTRLLGQTVADLWDAGAEALNGARIRLSGAGE